MKEFKCKYKRQEVFQYSTKWRIHFNTCIRGEEEDGKILRRRKKKRINQVNYFFFLNICGQQGCLKKKKKNVKIKRFTNEVSRARPQVLSADGDFGPGRALLGRDARDQRRLTGTRHGGNWANQHLQAEWATAGGGESRGWGINSVRRTHGHDDMEKGVLLHYNYTNSSPLLLHILHSCVHTGSQKFGHTMMMIL